MSGNTEREVLINMEVQDHGDMCRVLNVMRLLTRSQCCSKRMCVTWSRFDRMSITRAQKHFEYVVVSQSSRLTTMRDVTSGRTGCFCMSLF